jgi:hypothetical protein
MSDPRPLWTTIEEIRGHCLVLDAVMPQVDAGGMSKHLVMHATNIRDALSVLCTTTASLTIATEHVIAISTLLGTLSHVCGPSMVHGDVPMLRALLLFVSTFVDIQRCLLRLHLAVANVARRSYTSEKIDDIVHVLTTCGSKTITIGQYLSNFVGLPTDIPDVDTVMSPERRLVIARSLHQLFYVGTMGTKVRLSFNYTFDIATTNTNRTTEITNRLADGSHDVYIGGSILTPRMMGVYVDGYHVTNSTETEPGYNAFNRNSQTCWVSDATFVGGKASVVRDKFNHSRPQEWLQVQFPAPVTALQIRLVSLNTGHGLSCPSSFSVHQSMDNVVWTTLLPATDGVITTPPQAHLYSVFGRLKFIGLSVTHTQGADHCSVGQLLVSGY